MIFVVEDDPTIGQMECYALKSSGFESRLFESGREFWTALEQTVPELVLLDLMLPGAEDGYAILKRLRDSGRTRKLPVIIVTAKSQELDKVRGLDGGADDYLTKPFGILELISRVKAVLRRTGEAEEDCYEYQGICLRDRSRTVSVEGAPLELTYKEYELLKLLLKNKGIVLSRDRIMDLVWGDGNLGLESRTVDVHIKSLRQKLGDHGELIRTVRNVGYKLG